MSLRFSLANTAVEMLVFYHDELTEEDIKILSQVSEITKNDIAKMLSRFAKNSK